MSVEEWFEGTSHAQPPTDDDVSILWDGRRRDSRQAVMDWIAEVDARRAQESATGRDANA